MDTQKLDMKRQRLDTIIHIAHCLFEQSGYLSLSKGGMDYTFKLSSLMPAEISGKVLDKFIECNLEILEKVTADLRVGAK